MKPGASEKAVAAAREQARVLEGIAKQSGRTARAAKDRVRQAKTRLKLAKQEVSQARKAAKAAKRAFTEAMRSSEEAAVDVAAIEKRMRKAGGAIQAARSNSTKPNDAAPAPVPVPAKPKRRTVRRKSRVKAPVKRTVPVRTELVSDHSSPPVQPEPEDWEANLHVPGEFLAPGDIAGSSDIAVPTDVFADTPSHGHTATMPGADVSV